MYQASIKLPQEEVVKLNHMMQLSGTDIYEKYGLKRDETITFTAKFANGYEADIKLVICEEDSPFVDPVLFDSVGHEICVLEPDFDSFDGDYVFPVNGEIFTVKVSVL